MKRSTLFDTDSKGRTTLFYAADIGDMDAVKAILFKLTGTGIFIIYPQIFAYMFVKIWQIVGAHMG